MSELGFIRLKDARIFLKPDRLRSTYWVLNLRPDRELHNRSGGMCRQGGMPPCH